MTLRTVFIVAAVLLGLAAGPAAFHTLLPAVSRADSAIPWMALSIAFVACAIGLPFVLVSLVSSGNYKAMVRAWSVFELLAVVCVSTGVSDVVSPPGSSAVESHALMLVAIGLGLLSGLGLVKLSIRRNRSVSGV